MKIFEKIFITLAFLSTMLANSQQIDWNRINSQTAIDVITLQNLEQPISSSSSTQVIQLGDQNSADLQINTRTNIVVQQFGDQNSIYYNNAFTSKESKTAITTEGNNNWVDITGSNSISEGLHLNVKGENMTIFMRNY
ncbi:hypothetical protein CHRY9390_00607 [Chryseobacterium aquaeductus]|uniref:Curlin associated repeat-containing protein n=1 Tax=Chryseobacterium aquaeductus TaxID=2675056 RepID=A0A9N8MEV9_9FLAO|nr:hypothetical protein [Chryseobacterium aquaeductus]CAA7329958.1 hypothetical protein CHRY9390_00607 [Chryseobacterium potabilaquae]CAD7800277.1 hypothetical protein CHRY9390_00607 [Chryseobacterium aquaeductus]